MRKKILKNNFNKVDDKMKINSKIKNYNKKENIEMKRLWTHNKTIQKAIESYRIKKEQKEYLRTFKI